MLKGAYSRKRTLTADLTRNAIHRPDMDQDPPNPIIDHPEQILLGGIATGTAPESQLDLPMAVPKESSLNWYQRASVLEATMARLGTIKDKYADRNLLILQLWAERDGSKGAAKKVSLLARTTVWVVLRVLGRAKKGDFERLAIERPAGRKGRRQQIIDALRSGTAPEAVALSFKVHRTTVARACRQISISRKPGRITPAA